MTTVGILALQGGFAAHAAALGGNGIRVREVRTEDQLAGLSALILPGGESTTMLTLLTGTALERALPQVVMAGMPVMATCAGVILLAREVREPAQRSFGVLDAVVERNAYGRQRESNIEQLLVTSPDLLGCSSMEGVFIRAPRIVKTGTEVEVLATRGQDPVLLRQGRVLAATFHPELTPGSPVIQLFLRMLGGSQ